MLLKALLVCIFFYGCGQESTWQHQLSYDKVRFKEDTAECKTYARDMTNEQRKGMKLPATSPHGGVAEAFIIYGMFEELFENCMQTKGWYKKEK
jgi:hypothetical protein